MSSPLLVVDVAHPPRSADMVEEALLAGWSRIRNSAGLRILKVVHGYGSSGKGGSTREVARNWSFRNRDRFRGVIEGERYALQDPEVQELRKEVGFFDDSDLGIANPGVLLIWVK